MKKERKKIKKIFVVILCVLTVLVGGACAYLSGGYEATEEAAVALVSDEHVTVEKIDGAIVFMPEEPVDAMIFYPGGKVAHDAYAPLMRAYAEEGMACILVEMPFDLAVFDMNAADDYRNLYPEIENWYLGGHSLGGAMAAGYLEQHMEAYEGLILCAAYSTVDYSASDLKIISMYGSNDEVLNAEKYEECRANLPEDAAELIIEGGNHAYFGSYGLQDGDGTATITNDIQIADAVEFTMENIR